MIIGTLFGIAFLLGVIIALLIDSRYHAQKMYKRNDAWLKYLAYSHRNSIVLSELPTLEKNLYLELLDKVTE